MALTFRAQGMISLVLLLATGHWSEVRVPLDRACASLLRSPLNTVLTLELLLPAHPGNLHCPVHKEWLWALPPASRSPALNLHEDCPTWTGTARPEEHLRCPAGTFSKLSQELRTDTKHFYDTSPTFHTDMSAMEREKDRILRRGKPCSGKRRCRIQTLWKVLNVSFHSAWKSEIITAEP